MNRWPKSPVNPTNFFSFKMVLAILAGIIAAPALLAVPILRQLSKRDGCS